MQHLDQRQQVSQLMLVILLHDKMKNAHYFVVDTSSVCIFIILYNMCSYVISHQGGNAYCADVCKQDWAKPAKPIYIKNFDERTNCIPIHI